jgi:UTP-glucose-1-phosphate uridylyltransferase
MKPTLLILAAGMGSRYGGNKQMDAFGPNGEAIIDYSIYDAIRSGFGKVVFIIRDSFAEEFKNQFEHKLTGKIETQYVMQEMDSYIENFEFTGARKKPWGTAHAVLCAKEVINEPFAVINADDYYGSDGFEKAAKFLKEEVSPKKYCVIGYQLSKTISENGSVSRGVCEVDFEQNLMGIHERTKIIPEDGKIFYVEDALKVPLPADTPVSMNFWGFDEHIFDYIQKLFIKFLNDNAENPKAEFFIPTIVDSYINEGKGKIKVIPTSAQWFGVTYKEDAAAVKESIRDLIEKGVYPEQLF